MFGLTDYREMLEMAEAGIARTREQGEAPDARQLANRDDLIAKIAQLVAQGSPEVSKMVVTAEARTLTDRPRGGAKAANQYGVFQVKFATEAQHRYMVSLIDRKDLERLRDSKVMPLDPEVVRQQVISHTVNKRAASDLIDRLKALPERAGVVASSSGTPKASDKQLGLIRKLIDERELTADQRAAIEGGIDGLSIKGASATITKLFALPEIAPKPVAALEAGMYINDATGDLLRVYLGQQSGQLLCKRVVKFSADEALATGKDYDLEYQGRADRFVTADFRRMALEEAKVWGKATAHCCVCARRLDVPESVDAGIGPKCAGRV